MGNERGEEELMVNFTRETQLISSILESTRAKKRIEHAISDKERLVLGNYYINIKSHTLHSL